MSEGWSFRLLGELAAINGTTPVPLGSGRLRVVLATLLLRAGQTVSRDELIDRLWGDAPPARARSTVPTHVMRLRQALGDPDLITTRPSGYRIDIAPDQLDLIRFRAMVDRAGRLDPAAALAELRQALALWRGSALADVPSESLRRDETPRLDEERWRALERRTELELELGGHGDLISELTALTAQHPYRERFWHQLIRALSGAGRQADALAAYQEIRTRLDEDLGVRPGPALRRLHATILTSEDHALPVRRSVPVASPVPRQLPADAASFTGRDTDLAELDKITANRGAVVAVIHGTAGVGKTALAVHWSHQAAERFPDGQLHVDLHGFDPRHAPTDPGTVLARLLRSLDVEAGRIPVDNEEKAALYRSVTADRRLLVLLDNAADEEQVRPLLPGTPSCLALVTSRNQLTGLVAVDGAHSLRLDVLDRPEALLLLANVLGHERVAVQARAADELVGLCGRLPLALRLAAGKLRVSAGQSIASVVADLRDAGPITALEVAGDSRAAVRPALAVSYNALRPDERRLFRHLGLLPGRDFTPAAVAALLDARQEDVVRPLDGIGRSNLVESHEPGRYRLHDLVLLYAREVSETDRREPLRRLYDWYVAMTEAAARLLYPHVPMLSGPAALEVFAEAASAWTWLENELSNLGAIIESAPAHGMPAVAWRLADATRGFFLARTYHNDMWWAFARAGLSGATAAGDRQAQAAMHINLATASWSAGDNQGFLDHSEEAATLARDIGWRPGEAKALGNASHALLGLGRRAEALAYGERSVQMWRAEGAPEGMVHALRILAHMHSESGDLRAAERNFGEALDLARRNGSVFGELDALAGLAWAAWLHGDLHNAAKLYSRTFAMAQKLGSRFREAQGLGKLAEIASAEGRLARAEDLGQQALALVRTAGRTQNEVDILNAVGRIAVRAGQPSAAVTHHRQATGLADGPKPYHYGLTDALVGLADAHLALAEHDEAAQAAKRAYHRARELGYRILQGKAAIILAETELARDNHTQAAAHAGEALELHNATGHRPGIERAATTARTIATRLSDARTH
ncbi:AfsR/SARP family transcriptional regulator [Lentzea cavernae]|uniref:SARP family transcriptional regulator n=1 Tax=Lentzea cavernae TaxID=2020703 RepID=A0ABQ3MHE4_9PSEU|nr:BTAD domain-containing putative transcriptional regulator [Lentzea cavernae]GHH42320.1 SARP family transcriptional regulator [Lentzea cavernae]